ncbi:Chaperone protein DnaK [Gemmata obscuriglobus]|uniref:Hsp70 family protein n=1 Tax=Gemmata obscuriglobus TaxID=114 RepID=A0A2Z3H8K0_9BACT|nr:Hsp70 family protein [Gemmata obscuriglobus]AWM41211.1 Hsp70 family protein [Gemmata obscuriglobus]QEG25447.1 Chaperone protein DnaK [Gemmata obscuriglobus]VTR98606.1 Heat shock protein 70 family protein OS=Stigmatella aurantiaca (strain DW4/3-1) GN=STAUR_6031 PE=3 SV=1: HSP70 [Gemmata obscuriglobus UQM 2246]
MSSRFVVGLDLGTTNSALAYVDTGAGKDAKVVTLPIAQVVAQGAVEERPLLPSFLYLPGEGEQPAGALKLPWDAKRDYTVGEFARAFGSQVPTRLVSSAKSWLCHPGVDRRAPILPTRAPDAGARKVSPLEASTRYLKHIAEAWNDSIAKDVADNRLEVQDIVLTVPASFDAAARELTVEAARAAGFENLTLLEEPQAAFYAWLDRTGDEWRKQVSVGELVLVADVGGGTTDFTLIEVGEEDGSLALTRLAVGDHLLLGGDNMDLTLAYHASQALAAKGARLDAGQMVQLTYACRGAKEELFARPELQSAPVTVLGKGRSLVGGSIKHELTRADVVRVLVDGFFPECPRDALPALNRTSGLAEVGLPYVADAGITRHLASFLSRQAEALANREAPSTGKKKKAGAPAPTPATATGTPAAVLFNGGVFKGDPLRTRLLSVLGDWARAAGAEPTRELPGADLDLAVARGAAYYGLVKRGKGVRIRGGTARSYYIGVETNMPAVPGFAPPVKAICVAPFGMEEGTEADVPSYEVGVRVGTEAEFRFLGSTVRREDPPGAVVEEWEGQIDELAPVKTTLEVTGAAPGGTVVPVHLYSKVTTVGQLELWLQSRDGKQKWKLEFNAREGK